MFFKGSKSNTLGDEITFNSNKKNKYSSNIIFLYKLLINIKKTSYFFMVKWCKKFLTVEKKGKKTLNSNNFGQSSFAPSALSLATPLLTIPGRYIPSRGLASLRDHPPRYSYILGCRFHTLDSDCVVFWAVIKATIFFFLLFSIDKGRNSPSNIWFYKIFVYILIK